MRARAGINRGSSRRPAPSTTSRRTGSGQDDIERQLQELTSGAQVDDELAKMKAELGSGRRRLAALEQEENVIVRVSGEGQFKLPDEDAERLNELDNEAVAAAEDGDEGRFQELWSQMLDLVANDGNAVDGDELVESDVILPPRDISFEEARGEFTGDGLIPD